MSPGKFEHNKKIHLMTSQPGFVLSPICNMSCQMLSNLRHIQLKKQILFYQGSMVKMA